MTDDTDELLAKMRALAFAVESASSDFAGADDGHCVTCYHRNPDGPTLFSRIEQDAMALKIMRDKAESFGRALDERDVIIAKLRTEVAMIAALKEALGKVKGYVFNASLGLETTETKAQVARRLHSIVKMIDVALKPTSNEGDV